MPFRLPALLFVCLLSALPSGAQTLSFVDAAGNPAAELLEGGTARLRLLSQPANSSPYAPDSTLVVLQSAQAGDAESVTVTETGADTGVFEGTIELASGPAQADGRLQTLWGPPPGYLPEQVTAQAPGTQATVSVAGSRIMFLDAFGRTAASTAVGDHLRLRLEDHTQDDPQVRDSQMVQVTSLQGNDSEPVTLTETGFHTGVYEGSLPTAPGGSAPGVLATYPGGVAEADHFNTNTPQHTLAQEAMAGSSVLFVDALGRPAAEYLESSQAFARVFSQFANGNPAAADTTQVRLETALTGDAELITLTETGPDTSVFVGGVLLRLGPAQQGNSFLETLEDPGPPHRFDTLTAIYNDPFGGTAATAGLTGSRTTFVDVNGAAVTAYPVGSRVYVRVEDHNADQPGHFDTVQVTVAVPGGDTEPLSLLETGKSTGVFSGSLPLAMSSSFGAGNGTLEVNSPGVIFTAEHLDAAGYTHSQDEARAAFARVDFIDAAGKPTAELLEGGIARLRMFNQQANAVPYAADSAFVELHSRYAGDGELLMLTETGADTNVFEGTIQLASGPAQGDGQLQTLQGPPPEYLPEEVTADAYDAAATAHVAGSRMVFLDAFGRTVTSTAVGDRLRLRLEDHTQDNPQTRDSQMVQVTSLQGSDSEPVTLTETGFHTGVYEGSLPTAPGGSQPGVLGTYPGDVAEADHFNTNTPQHTKAQVAMTGSSVLFVDAQGQPVATYLESSQAFVRVISQFANGNPSAADTTQVRLQTELSGDIELITLTETGPNTSVFTGGIALRLGPAQPGDGFLETLEAPGPPHEFDLLTAIYNDPFGSSLASAGLTGSRSDFVDAYGTPVESYPLGSRIYIRVEDHNFDQPGHFDLVQVTVAVPGGDSEPLSLLETGKSTGIFLGSLPLAMSPGFGAGNGTLEVNGPGALLTAEHLDAAGYTSSKDEARVAFAALLFIDEDGNPTSELLEGGTARLRMFNQPANGSPFSADSVTVALHSQHAGDAETATLTETGPNTSVFEGTIQLASGPAQGDGQLQTLQGPPPAYLPEEVTADAYDGVATAHVAGSRMVFLDAFGRVVTSTAVGDRLRLRLEDHTQDNPQTRDAQMVQVTSLQGGDTEPVTLTETGFHTGVYEGSLPTEPGGSQPGLLGTYPGDVAEADHFNTNTPQHTKAQVAMTGSSVLFVDAQGQPVATYLESSQAFVRVVSQFANGNPSLADTTQVRLQTELTSDIELVTLTETGPNTSVFTGGIFLRLGPSQPGSGFVETLEAPGPPHEFDTLTAIYNDPFGGSTATAGLTGSRTEFVDAYGTPVTVYPLGSRIYVRVEDHNFDQPGHFDLVQVTVAAPGGDSEPLSLLETGKSTGIFLGSLPLAMSPGFGAGNDTLEVNGPGALLTAEHLDAAGYTSSKDEARVAFAALLFIDEDGNPTSELLEGGTARLRMFNQPANGSPFSADSVTVALHSQHAGDAETATLTETGPNTSVFEGTIQLASGPAQGDGQLQTLQGPPPAYLPEEVTADAYDGVATAHVAGSRMVFLDAFGRMVTSTAVGDRLRLRLEDHTQDNPQTRDAQMVQVTSLQGGDTEPVTLTETGFHTGVYEGSLPTAPGGSQPGVLGTYPGDVAEADHFNTSTPQHTKAQVEMTGSSVLFVDAQGQPVATYLESSQAFVRVVSQFANGNPSLADTTQVRLQTELTGDIELVTLTETGPNTSVFTGGIFLRLGPSQPGSGFLETLEAPGPPHEFDTLTAIYNDPFGGSAATAGLTGSRTEFVDAYGTPVTVYPLGSRIYVRVEDHNFDQPGHFDLVQVTVAAPGGDSEPLSLLETGKSTGIFLGSLPLAMSPGFGAGNGTLEVNGPGALLTAEHLDAAGYTSSKDEARVAFAALLFIDEDGNPTSELLEGGTARLRMFNQPANGSPFSADSVTVALHSQHAGDAETATLTETGPNTSVFEGTIQLASGPAQGDGQLQTLQGPPPAYLPEEVTADAYDGVATAQVAGSRMVFLDAFGRVVTSTAVGDRLRLRLEDHTQDNPQTRDAQMVQVTSLQGGDTEPVTLTETGFHTGVYEGSLPTEPGGSQPGVLGTYPGDVAEADHSNTNTPQHIKAQVAMTGSSVLFVDAQGQPVATYLESSQAFVRVVSQFANSNPTVADTTQVRLQTELTGDIEMITLTETGPNTSVFTGGIFLRLGPGQQGSGFLETLEAQGPPHEFDTLTAIYNDPFGGATATAGLTGSRTDFVDAYGALVSTYPLGSRIYVRVEDHNLDQPGHFDLVQVTVAVPGGDSEPLSLLETGKSTGIFLGSLPLALLPSFGAGNGTLEVFSPGVLFTAEHLDAAGYTSSQDEAQAVVSALAFIDENGTPTSELLEGGTARLRMFNQQANASNHAADSVLVAVHSRHAGDSETVTLTETSANSSVFEGTVQLATGPAQGDGKLQTFQGPPPEYLPEEVTASAYDSLITAHVAGSRMVFVDAFGRAVTSTAVGDRLRLRLEDHTQDDPQSRDSQMVQVTSLQSGDSEPVTLTETGFHTGVYEGSLATDSVGVSGNVLSTFPGDVAEADHGNTSTPQHTRAQVTLTGSSVLFVDAQGQPVVTYLESSQAFVRVVSRFANSNPSVADTTQVRLQTELTGDVEMITLTETGPNSSVFTGGIFLRLGPGQQGSGFLETLEAQGPPHEFDLLTAIYNDPFGSALASAGLTGSRTTFVDAYGQPAESFPVGSRIYVQVEDHNLDLPGQVDHAQVTVRAESGDTESFPLTETGLSTGLFVGSIPLDLSSGSTPGNGRLQVFSPGVAFEAEHTDALGFTSSKDQAVASYSELDFIDEAGVPTTELLEGGTARLRMFNQASNNNPNSAETVTVALHSRFTGDAETATLTETGLNTSVFEGTIQLATGPAQGDGKLQTLYGPSPEYLADEVTADAFDGRATAHVAGSRAAFLNLRGQTVTTYPLRSTVRVRVLSQGANNPAQVDSLFVILRALGNGDEEALTLTETGAATGIFEATLPSLDTPTPSQSGSLSAAAGEVIEVESANVNTPARTRAQATFLATFAPLAADDTAQTVQDNAVAISVLANDSGTQPLTVGAVSPATHGTVAANPNGTVTYTPATGYFGPDSFTYIAVDAQNGEGRATVTVTVTPANRAPVAVNDTATVAEDGTVNVAVLANDTDPDNDTLNVTSVTQGAHGAVVINPDKTVKYTPAANYNGPDTFTYTISDGNGHTATATVNVTVTPVNDAPVAVADTATVAEDGTVNVAVLANDTDPENNTLSVTSVTQGAHGVVVINPDKTVKYTPAANYNGSDTFTYTISDGNGGTATGTVTMTVTAVNDAPVAVADSASVAEDGTVNVAVLTNDTDSENDTLSVTSVTQGAHGAVVINPDKTVKYTPAANYNGPDTFTYTISDSNGGTATGTVTVTVTAVNDAPVAVADSASVAEDGRIEIPVLANDTDPENDTLSVTSVTQGAHGTVVINPDKTVKYSPVADYSGADSFTYSISDGHGGTATGTVTMTVTPVNDAPVASADAATVAEDGTINVSVLSNDTDPENDTLSVTSVTQGAHGAVVINPDKTVKYTPTANYNGSDTFTYTISDGHGGTATAAVTITVSSVNDAPVASADAATVVEDNPVTVSVLANDSDLEGNVLSVTSVTQGAHGAVVINPDKTVRYTPAANYNGADSFTYTISDGNGGIATAGVSITVTPVNDAPVAVNDTASTTAEVAVTISVLTNDSDVDGPSLLITARTLAAHGTVAFNASQTAVKYTPAANWIGPDSFTYTISDGAGGSATATVNVTVLAPPRVSTNLQVLYPFSEGSGTVVHDTSGVGTPLDLTISTPAAAAWSTGALRFSATNLAQTAGNATKVITAVQASNALTVEAWIAPTNLTQNGPAAIVSISLDKKKRDVTLGQTTSRYENQLRTSTTNQAGDSQSTATGVVTTTLQHVVFTRDSAGTTKTWINGTQVATSTIAGNLSTWTRYKLGLGNELAGGCPWLGTFHLVAVYSRALTAAEIHQNFLAGKDGN